MSEVHGSVSLSPGSYFDVADAALAIPFTVNCITAFIAILSATILRFILVRLNKKLDRGESVKGVAAMIEGIPDEAARKGFRFLY